MTGGDDGDPGDDADAAGDTVRQGLKRPVPDPENVRQVLKRVREDRSSSRTHEMHKRQLRFAFRILASTLLAIMVMCAFAVALPPEWVIERLKLLEATDSFKWMTGIVNTIVGGAIGLALGSYYSQNVGDH